MIKISAVSYFNTIPFIYGLKKSKLVDSINLQLNYPSVCADKLINGDVDLALVPIVILPLLDEPQIISEYCIGANGAVETVCLYSDTPINKIESISLDYQSKTSVKLLKILLKEYWKIDPILYSSEVGFERKIYGNHAALVIGDRAFELNSKHKYIYDLPLYWKEMTGLPFVFAAWVSTKKLDKNFIKDFNYALKEGLNNIEIALNEEGSNYINCKNYKDYLNNKISYHLDSQKLKGMHLFLKKITN